MVGYVKLPLIFGCLGLFQVALMEFLRYRDGLSSGLTWDTLSFAAFSFALHSLIGFGLVAYHRAKVRSLTSDTSESAFSVRQERTLLLHLPFEQTFTVCKESLSVIDKHWLIEEKLIEGKILLRTKPTLLEWWRDTVTFTLTKAGDTLTEVKLESRPTGRTPLVDNGKNLRRVQKLTDFLQSKDKPLNLLEAKEKIDDLFSGLRERERTPAR